MGCPVSISCMLRSFCILILIKHVANNLPNSFSPAIFANLLSDTLFALSTIPCDCRWYAHPNHLLILSYCATSCISLSTKCIPLQTMFRSIAFWYFKFCKLFSQYNGPMEGGLVSNGSVIISHFLFFSNDSVHTVQSLAALSTIAVRNCDHHSELFLLFFLSHMEYMVIAEVFHRDRQLQ